MDAPVRVSAKGGGPAPLALRAHPLGYFSQDEGGARGLVPLLLRGGLAVLALWLVVRVLPALPDLVAAGVVVLLGAVIGLPAAWGASVRRGHGLRTLATGGRLRMLLGGSALRVALAGLAGVVGAALLLLRLVEAEPAIWALALFALPLTWALMAWLAPHMAAEVAGVHARRLVQLWAQVGAVAVLLALALGLAVTLPAPQLLPLDATTGAPLVAEALALSRLWAGLEAFALGQAAEFGAWGRGLAALVSALALGGVFWALSGLAVALALPWGEWRRAIAPASDAAAPPAPGRLGPGVAVVVALAVLSGAGMAGRHLAALPPADRPSARVAVAVEMIGEALYRAGTHSRIEELHRAALAEDGDARARLRAALNAGFDAMEGNVDPFLDDFYSLSGEYGRIWRWAMGNLEAHMTAQVTEALQSGAPFAAYERLQASILAEAEARAEGLAQAEAAILAANRIEGVNPARLLVTARHGIIAPPAGMLADDLTRAQVRWGVSAGTGVVATIMARRVVAGLATRGLIGTAARMVMRAGGLLLAFGVDYALVKLDEYQNRDDFRDAILAEIAGQRAAALAAFD
jgi:hypothetical protein